jgi:hypothetical protein
MTSVKTGKQRVEHEIVHEGITLPQKTRSVRPIPPVYDQQDPTFGSKNLTEDSHVVYIKGTNIKKIASITTWDLDACHPNITASGNNNRASSSKH